MRELLRLRAAIAKRNQQYGAGFGIYYAKKYARPAVRS